MQLDGGTWRAIGVVHSPHKSSQGTPIQPNKAKGITGTVEIDPLLERGLSDLDGFDYIHLITWLDRAGSVSLKVVPFLDDVERGLFATRAPNRPNPIGLSTVRLLKVEGNVLHIEGVDMLDGTPVLDIKPYVPSFESRPDARQGWIEAARVKRDRGRADDRFIG